MTSPQFITFLERKLIEAGVAKIIPDDELLGEVFAGLERGRRLQKSLNDLGEANGEDCQAPKDLRRRVAALLKKKPALRWDAALLEISAKRTCFPPRKEEHLHQ
jgi:hypothetical protein